MTASLKGEFVIWMVATKEPPSLCLFVCALEADNLTQEPRISLNLKLFPCSMAVNLNSELPWVGCLWPKS